MRLFIRDIVSCFFVIAFLMEFILLFADNNYSYKSKYLTAHNNDIDILLLGNSYFENGLNSSVLSDSAFNAASSARWIYYDKLIAEKYIPTMGNLKTVIFPMSYKTPFYHSYHYKNKYTGMVVIYDYAKFMHLFYDKFPQKYIYWSALLTGNFNFDQITSKRNCNDDGYCPLYGSVADFSTAQNVDPEIINVENVDKQVAEYTQYLMDIAKVCRDNGVRFIVVTPPCHDIYIQNTRKEGMDVLLRIIASVKAKYPVEYENYLYDDDYRADTLYYNCSHLNNIGAIKFAKRLKSDFNL